MKCKKNNKHAHKIPARSMQINTNNEERKLSDEMKTCSSLIWLWATTELRYMASMDLLQVSWKPITVLVSVTSSVEFAYFSRGGKSDACFLRKACEFEILWKFLSCSLTRIILFTGPAQNSSNYIKGKNHKKNQTAIIIRLSLSI